MADRKTVMSWLEGLAQDDWQSFHSDSEVQQIAMVALELLKEQEAKHGEWIDIWREDDPDTSSHAKCSVCNLVSARPVGAYCKWCGTKMDDEVESR